MKVHVIKRGEILNKGDFGKKRDYYNVQVHYCGYLEIEDPFNTDLWEFCNWSCWSEETPEECKNLWITHCNSDVSYIIDGEYYSHFMHKFKDFNECYHYMMNTRNTDFFDDIFPVEEGLNIDKLVIVNPSNIEEIINKY